MVAAIDGVATVPPFDAPGFGNYVIIIGAQYKTYYAHLSQVAVKTGQSVIAGQQIGLSGNTGNSSGAHLHFGVKPLPFNNNNGYLGAVDPLPLIGVSDMTLATESDVRILAFHILGRNGHDGTEMYLDEKVPLGNLQTFVGHNLEATIQQFYASQEGVNFREQRMGALYAAADSANSQFEPVTVYRKVV